MNGESESGGGPPHYNLGYVVHIDGDGSFVYATNVPAVLRLRLRADGNPGWHGPAVNISEIVTEAGIGSVGELKARRA